VLLIGTSVKSGIQNFKMTFKQKTGPRITSRMKPVNSLKSTVHFGLGLMLAKLKLMA
jgi:hypothetical protein